MSRAFSALIAVVLTLAPESVGAEEKAFPNPPIGQNVSSTDLAQYFAIQPDGRGLPEGRGDAKTGQSLYIQKCGSCHGDKLQGIPATGAPALAGGRGQLKAVPAKKTVESYWPYATTLFDYVKRAMPFNAPGSLTNDEVYSISAYILAYGKIVPDDVVMDKDSLAKVKMPNRDGFVPYDNAKIVRFH